MHKVLTFVFLGLWLTLNSNLAIAENKTCNSFVKCMPLAKQGDAFAQFFIGYSYHYGKETEQNFSLAQQWYKNAAHQNHIGAQINGGQTCIVNKGQNMFTTWTEEANSGDTFSQNCLANLYHNGYGVSVDNEQAAIWYQKAAKQGYADAQYNLAHMYYSGLGIEQNIDIARKWMQKAVDQGHIKAIDDIHKLD